jgi:hypothetical protein
VSEKAVVTTDLYTTQHSYDAVAIGTHKADVEKQRVLAAKKKLG